MEIRKLKIEDLDKILEISRVSFRKPWPRNEFKKYINESFAAEENGEVVGFVINKISRKTGVIKLIAVDRGHRGKGIGESLMKYILRHFSEIGLEGATARSRIHNEAGCTFLKSFGFEVTETVKNYYQDGEDAYLMKRKLGA